MQLSPKTIGEFQKEILTWYGKHKRDLPWREIPVGISLQNRAYRILVSEIMLQQTQVARVMPKYKAWLAKFPTIKSLAKAKPADVLRLWSGLGYNRRALFLQKTAQAIVNNYQGKFPQDENILSTLPGIGNYTAKAVMCFAFGKQVAVVDTNVRKVILIHFSKTQKSKLKSQKEIQNIADQLLPKGKAYEWNQALMDYATAMLKKEKVPIAKQSKFKDSNRYYRGQIIKLLIKQQTTNFKDLRTLLQKDELFLQTVLETLVKDKLVVWEKEKITLPQEKNTEF